MHVHEVVKHVIDILRTEVAIGFRSLSNQNNNEMLKLYSDCVFTKTITLLSLAWYVIIITKSALCNYHNQLGVT